MRKHDLFDKPGNVFNMDESGIQIINKPGKVVTEKGFKTVHALTSSEKGETVTIIACMNAEGRSLPPVLIMKGTNKRRDVCDGLPPGSEVFMNPKSAYINTELFMKWFKEFFLPKKSPGTNLLILNGHISHSSSLELLQLADSNNVVILCLPPHTSHVLQPLDKTFFGPLKEAFGQETKAAIRHSGKEGLTRSRIGYLFGAAWKKVASVENAVSGFKKCGIFPLNQNAIPEYVYSISDASSADLPTNTNKSAINFEQATSYQPIESITTSVQQGQSSATSTSNQPSNNTTSCQPGPSGCSAAASAGSSTNGSSTKSDQLGPNTTQKLFSPNSTPTKILHEVSPIPKLRTRRPNKRRLTAAVLTSEENIEKKKSIVAERETKEREKKARQLKKNSEISGHNKITIGHEDSSKECPLSDDTNRCAECWENYFSTKKREDWFKCIKCDKWLHENCTMYKHLALCNDCGRLEIRREHVNKQK